MYYFTCLLCSRLVFSANIYSENYYLISIVNIKKNFKLTIDARYHSYYKVPLNFIINQSSALKCTRAYITQRPVATWLGVSGRSFNSPYF